MSVHYLQHIYNVVRWQLQYNSQVALVHMNDYFVFPSIFKHDHMSLTMPFSAASEFTLTPE